MAMGRDGSEEWGFCSHLAWFCLTQSPHDGENFLTPSPPLEAPQSPVLSRKTLLLVNLSTTITIVFN